jgi:tRNA A37 threonylcarbamoyladenosine dehydratase
MKRKSSVEDSEAKRTKSSENMSATHANLTKEQLAYEDRWSRLAASLGLEALKRFQTARVLVSGLKGLGLEIGTVSLGMPPYIFCS